MSKTKISIRLDNPILEKIDDMAREKGTRSSVIVNILKRFFEKERK